MSSRSWSRVPYGVLVTLALAIGAGCPSVESIEPDPAQAGDPVVIAGSSFGTTQGASQVLYDGVPLAITTWSDSQIDATLPSPKADGTYAVQVQVGGQLSNPLTHTIAARTWDVLVPDGAVAFHQGTSCPAGWQPLVDAQGRFLVGRTDGTQVGVTVGAPLAQGEDRTHTHGYATTVDIGSTGVAGLSGCCTDVGAAGTQSVGGTADAAHAGPPRIAQLACQRVVESPPPVVDDHAFPNGSVVLFHREGCPDGFQLTGEANGRFLLPTPIGGTVGQTVGTALASGEDRGHSHTFSSSIDVPQQSLAAANGSNGRAPKGTKTFSGVTSASAAGVPYLQLLACRAIDRPAPPVGEPITGDPLPSKTFSYFDLDTCPEGWTRSGLHAGRFPVGLLPPSGGGVPYETRGGAPLVPGEDRQHTHAFSGSVTVPNHEVILAPGCCNDKFGANGTFGYSGTTGPAGLGMPYLSLLGCEKD